MKKSIIILTIVALAAGIGCFASAGINDGRVAYYQSKVDYNHGAFHGASFPSSIEWEGPAGFGNIEFVVTSGWTGINQITLDWSNFSCGIVTFTSGALNLSFSTPKPIINNQFFLEIDLAPPFSTEDMSISIAGLIENSRASASGTYEADIEGTICSGTWFAYPISGPIDADGDGVEDNDDAFPNDIAASIDTDGDGYPDSWNAGYSQTDSTTGLTLDDYPNDASKWGEAIPQPPQTSYSISGTNITVNWTSVPDATGYTLYFAPYPFTGPESIQHVDMGTNTSISVNLWLGASYFVAVTAYNEAGESGYSNIELFTIPDE